MIKIAIASDHVGVDYKKKIIEHFQDKYNFLDCSLKNDPLDDYPDFAFKVSKLVSSKKADVGILICGTGIGMSIAANKVKGIRCAHLTRVEDATFAKIHNDANVIALASYIDIDTNIEIVKKYLETNEPLLEKHQRRVNKIIKYESGEYNEL